MEKREFKDRLYTEFARVGRALASPHRLELLDLLAQGERSVEDLAAEAALSFANTSQHLRLLAQAQLVEVRREGPRVYYRLGSPEVFMLWQALRTTAEARLAEIDRVAATFLSGREKMEAVGPDELRQRLADGDITVLDVRPVLEYRQGHIMGAVSIPLDELEARLAELPPGRRIVAYCRGPFCVYADEAVELLSREGRSAARLSIGYPDWAASGLPVTAGAEGLSSLSRRGA